MIYFSAVQIESVIHLVRLGLVLLLVLLEGHLQGVLLHEVVDQGDQGRVQLEFLSPVQG